LFGGFIAVQIVKSAVGGNKELIVPVENTIDG